MKKITVFTPTYNRCYIIGALYESLKKQTFQDFEWIVVDDGSTDDTEAFFAEILKEEHFFDISYVKVENGGKHRAINQGLSMAKGELFFIVDSDDYVPCGSAFCLRKGFGARIRECVQCRRNCAVLLPYLARLASNRL